MRRCLRDWLGAAFASLVFGATFAGAAAEALPAADGNRPLRIIKDTNFEFPARLLLLGITSGEVRLFLNVDAHGDLIDHLFVAFTHYELANEVSRVVPRWRYEPARAEGRAISAIMALTVRFQTNGLVVTEKRDLVGQPTAENAFMFRARELRELDAVPRVVFSVAPPTPVETDETPIAGRVRVDFYIDEKGNVRMPVVASADDERLGWVATAAIAKWQFETPRRGGYPVLARASQVFVFGQEG